MNAISLQDAHYFLSQSTGVLLEGRYIEPFVFEIEDNYDNEWLVLQWDEVEGDQEGIVSISFLERDNQTVFIEGSKLILTAENGEEEEITLLREWKPTQTQIQN
jgi:hypothetical protein